MLDAKLIFSNDQEITSTDVSDNVIDLGTNETALGEEENLRLRVTVSEDFTSGESDNTLTVQCLQDGDDTPSDQWAESMAVPKATLVAGYTIMDIGLPTYHQRYMGVNYVVGGTGNFSGGKVNAYIYAR